MNGMQAVTDLSKYISKNIDDIQVFKIEKPTNFEGNYICLNYLNISYGRAVNTSCIVNVNLHARDMTNSQPDTEKLQRMSERIFSLIPCRNIDTEDDERELIIGGAWYNIESDSNCIKDNDGTHFINIRVQVTFTN